jgi:glucose-1-phosphatase
MKTLFLDFGNVIGFFDHSRAIAQLLHYTDLSAEQLEPLLYGGELGHDFDSGAIDTATYVRRARELGRLKCTEAEFLDAYTDIFWPNPDVCEWIPHLAQRYRLVLASNTNAAHYARFMPMFAAVLRHIDCRVASHLVGSRKPDATFYQCAQRFAEAEPHECLFVDDLEKNIVAATQHGWTSVHYPKGSRIVDRFASHGISLC